ncbi:hypothetical protein CROQUDRAFT_662069 [Cronartium quercuum f. sp. fusiforme G11]|uniref:Uncharacterized protein n=1 Tax=Cronartium quercuum f. sp. fusiforme G11 TaxID=708437 RepID=A0A9P6NBD4_9BASI|nr:hypothetical protein CROQUDRAFT_662069 [Cronartium quercuum f. sp. fusiforme G11]
MGVMHGDAISLIHYAVPYYKFIMTDSTPPAKITWTRLSEVFSDIIFAGGATVKHLNNDETYPSDDEHELYSEGECAGDFSDASDLNKH